MSSLANFHRLKNVSGQHMANSLNTRVDANPAGSDNLTGTLTSPEFTIDRNYIRMLIAGGKQPNACFVELLVDGKSVAKHWV